MPLDVPLVALLPQQHVLLSLNMSKLTRSLDVDPSLWKAWSLMQTTLCLVWKKLGLAGLEAAACAGMPGASPLLVQLPQHSVLDSQQRPLHLNMGGTEHIMSCLLVLLAICPATIIKVMSGNIFFLTPNSNWLIVVAEQRHGAPYELSDIRLTPNCSACCTAWSALLLVVRGGERFFTGF